MRENFLVFGAPLIGEEEIAEVVATLKSGWIGTGPRVARFEKMFADYKGGGYVAAVNSGTAALHLSMIAAGLKPGDEVITTPLTFCATVNAIIHAGARPVLADVDPVTMNISPERVEEKVTARTRAILPVHFGGRLCDMNVLTKLADKRHLDIIEDCAHAIESEYKGRTAGTFGRFGCFSFYVTKNLITGEGGMVLCRDKKDADKIKRLALHGLSADAWKRFSDSGYKHYYVVEPGYKYNMMDIQAAMGIHQLARIGDCHQRRTEIWERYDAGLADLPVTTPAAPRASEIHARHLYTILVDEKEAGISRDDFLEGMTKRKIGVGVHYLSLPEHPYYRETFGWRTEDYPEATRIGRQTVSLPLSPRMTDRDVDDVLQSVRELIGG